jgi:hypothetical protein
MTMLVAPKAWKRLITVLVGAFASACSTIQGYPVDPENTQKAMQAVGGAFDGTDETAYYRSSDSAYRAKLRNDIIAKRVRGYDLAFSSFERQLLTSNNSLSLGTDLAAITLGGLIATVGGQQTKAVLGQISSGVVGANAAINKDLFYQKSIPALISQMKAERAKVLLVIITKSHLSDEDYPLYNSMYDLDEYRDAGSIPNAIAALTEVSTADKNQAEAALTFIRSPADVLQTGFVNGLEAQISKLADAQVLKMMAAMEPKLTSRAPALQSAIKQYDPSTTRTANATSARRVLQMWLAEDTITPSTKAEWQAAIDAAGK